MSTKSVSLVTLLLLGAIWGCSEDDSPVRSGQTPPPYYPNTLGSYWKYVAYDSVRDTVDTIVIEIMDTATIDSNRPTASNWRYPSAHQWFGVFGTETWVMLDTQYAKSGASDSLLIAWIIPDHYVWVKEVYLLPFEVGNKWAYDPNGYLPDSTFVVDSSTIVCPAGSFPGTFQVLTRYNCGDECGAERTMWYRPGVGVVQFSRWEWDHFDYPDAPQINATWTLIDYHIAQP